MIGKILKSLLAKKKQAKDTKSAEKTFEKINEARVKDYEEGAKLHKKYKKKNKD